MSKQHFIRRLFAFVLLSGGVIAPPLSADPQIPTISIIIDDIGYRHKDDQNAIALPGPIAYAIMPYGPFTKEMSSLATENGKEVILHQPMQANSQTEALGPGALTVEMSKDHFLETLNQNIDAVPNIIGMNNHMGSLLTRQSEQMLWMMEVMKTSGFFYVDSKTINESVVQELAELNDIPYLSRDVFLDNEKDEAYIKAQFLLLVETAKRKGSALGIGHPHAETIKVLNEVLQDTSIYGVKVVGLKSLLTAQSRGKRYAQGTDTAGPGL